MEGQISDERGTPPPVNIMREGKQIVCFCIVVVVNKVERGGAKN
jgi:hypothetical protein